MQERNRTKQKDEPPNQKLFVAFHENVKLHFLIGLQRSSLDWKLFQNYEEDLDALRINLGILLFSVEVAFVTAHSECSQHSISLVRKPKLFPMILV